MVRKKFSKVVLCFFFDTDAGGAICCRSADTMEHMMAIHGDYGGDEEISNK